jgi:ABC-type branched-subunit amino acid transport system ATPase component
VRGLHKRFGSLVTASGIDLDVRPFQLHSLIGPNGAGKTTLFNMLTGILAPNAGEILPACRCTSAPGSAWRGPFRSSACSPT